jgi:hypothetical protein
VDRSSTSALVIMNDSPHGNERAWNALRLAMARHSGATMIWKTQLACALHAWYDHVGCLRGPCSVRYGPERFPGRTRSSCARLLDVKPMWTVQRYVRRGYGKGDGSGLWDDD